MNHHQAAHVVDVLVSRVQSGHTLSASERAEWSQALAVLHRVTR